MSFHRKLLPEFLLLLILLWDVPKVSGTQVDIVAVVDSYTSSVSPNTNFGGSEFLNSYYYIYGIFNQTFTQACVTWLKFDLSIIPSNATVDSAILRLHTTMIGPAATNRIGVFPCSDSNWQEMTINWNNSRVLALHTSESPVRTVLVSKGDWDYDFDVTSAVKSQNVVTLVLKTLAPTGIIGQASFYSREKQETHYRPRLVVEYSDRSSISSLNSVLWLTIFVAIVAVVAFATYYVIRKKQQHHKTPMRRRGLVRALC